jgi:histone H3/H4
MMASHLLPIAPETAAAIHAGRKTVQYLARKLP